MISVAVKYFWTGSEFYPGSLSHCIALPLEPVPPDMAEGMKSAIVPHWRFAPVPARVKQTIGTLPGYVVAKGDVAEWHLAFLELTEHGYVFRPDPEHGE